MQDALLMDVIRRGAGNQGVGVSWMLRPATHGLRAPVRIGVRLTPLIDVIRGFCHAVRSLLRLDRIRMVSRMFLTQRFSHRPYRLSGFLHLVNPVCSALIYTGSRID